MNWVACNFGKNLELEKSQEFNDTFSYMKVYFGKLNWECVTMERSIFSKYVNNTRDINQWQKWSLTESRDLFPLHLCKFERKKLMVLDVQGKGYCLCNPEIGSADLRDANGDTFLLCFGNLSFSAIEKFKELQGCNQ